MVTMSPMSVAPVCDVGDPLQLICTASVEFIRWSIMVVNDQGIIEEITVNINSGDTSQQMSQRLVNSTTFIFMRSSAQNRPLVSTLSIDSVSTGLNGTVVHCVEVGGSMASASTTIQIRNSGLYIDHNYYYGYTIIYQHIYFDHRSVYSNNKSTFKSLWN